MALDLDKRVLCFDGVILPEQDISIAKDMFAVLFYSSVCAETEEFPQQFRGFWGRNQETCDVLKTRGPAYANQDQEWLKITATEVLGSIQGRFFQERPARKVKGKPTLSVEVQLFLWKALMEELTLYSDGHLFAAVVDKRAGMEYQRC
jgi:hypothetical protein